MEDNFSLLVKPASADCNLSCAYCFYLERAALYPETSVHRMSPEVMERMVSSFLATEQLVYGFGWQGGEPALMGVDFYRRVIRCQEKNARPGSVIANGFQTNGLLVDDEFAAFLGENRFLVGVSLDGPADIHDRFRHAPDGKGTHDGVIRAIERLRRHRVEFNILALVNSAGVGSARRVYDYFLENGFRFQQYIPCLETDGNGRPLPWSVSGEAWGEFLCELFDAWYPGDVGLVSIRLFEDIVAKMVEGRVSSCNMNDNCCRYFVVEYNGDIYPCDFFVYRDLRLGNITREDWSSLRLSGKYLDFGRRKAQVNHSCVSCPFHGFCFGDCLKHRLAGGVPEPTGLSRLCAGWRKFYREKLPAFEELAGEVRRRRLKASSDSGREIGRNDPCPCGSRLKYKKCCLLPRD